uniref:symplekin-like n=1 Tax=Styela clava TaxID=7725 RepID=UPI00193A5F26|nr:symplekin-like [Styela clava]
MGKPKKTGTKSQRSSNSKDQDDESASSHQSTSERVIDLLNQASMALTDPDKVNKLKQVQELIVNKEPALLDSFTDEVLAFQADRSHDVRKFVVGFMEEACKKDNELLMKVMANLNLLLADTNANVTKKLIQSMTQLFRIVIYWLTKGSFISDSHKACWKVTCNIRDHIYELLDSVNDGVRTQTVKFVEKVILILSEIQRGSEVPKKTEPASSIDEIPLNHALLKRDELKADGEIALQKLLGFIANPAISSVNLMAAMGTLSAIAKQRPQFMGTVVQAFEALHANLPPTLAKTQVASVRKHLKMQLMNMLRLFSSTQYHPQITNLLYDLGTTSSEIAKNMPKLSQRQSAGSSRKRSPDEDKGEGSGNKKMKREVNEYDDDVEIGPSTSSAPAPVPSEPVVNQHSVAIDITAKQLVPLLSPENVANLVLLSMVMLPDKMPDAFQASYTPIESAGTEDQISHLARLLSIQMTAMGVGSGVQKAAEMAAEEDAKKREKKLEEEGKQKLQIQTVIGGTTKPTPVQEDTAQDKSKKNIEAMISSQTVVPNRGLPRRIQGFRLESITTPLDLDTKDKIIKNAVLRVLRSEQAANAAGVHAQWSKILTSLVAQFGGDLHRALAMFILEDIRNRSSLAFAWLYEEFNIYLENSRGSNDKSAQENYDACLTGLLQGFREKPETRDSLFNKLVMQAPLLTDGAIKQVRLYCEDEKRSQSGIKLVKDLLHYRITRKMQFLRLLLDLCVSKNESTQTEAVECIKSIFLQIELQDFIRTYAVTHLEYLSNSAPPLTLVPEGTPVDAKSTWTETQMKQCMTLFLALLPLDHNLIETLAEVYVKTSADVKRVVLRILDKPVSQMGMESPQLLRLVEGCPKGAETLVTRMLHILTDKTHPTVELVQRVTDLYAKRVPDVRFLIPVLNGLEKNEVLKALPKLVRLNPPVVKGVFNRLLGVNRGQQSEPSVSSLSPVELLIALHNMDSNTADVKSVIKATSLCFAEKAVYTSEVLVTVINHLVEQAEIPTLLMRTVIQSLITYPRLSGFVMNVLQRLILKKVWEQEKVWDGFIRCCQRMKPQSFQVLLQLPSVQLSSVFDSAPELREPMLQYVERFTPQQKLHVNKDVLALLERKPTRIELEKAVTLTIQQQTAELALTVAEQQAREEQQKMAEEYDRIQKEKEQSEAKTKLIDEQVKKAAKMLQEQEERTKALELFQKRGFTNVKMETNEENVARGGFPTAAPGPSQVVAPGISSTPMSSEQQQPQQMKLTMSTDAEVPQGNRDRQRSGTPTLDEAPEPTIT